MHATAIIAEDEPVLRHWLASRIGERWPDLEFVAAAEDGPTALARLVDLRPDVCFIDVRMPGMTGIEVIEEAVEVWPADRPLPLVVFVTAFSDFAVRAFEAESTDYLVKPVSLPRLDRCLDRLKRRLDERRRGAVELTQQVEWLRTSLDRLAPLGARWLEVLQVPVGTSIHFIGLDEVVYFEAADKYVRVVTSVRDFHLRGSLKDLIPQLNPSDFWQIHRRTVVRVADIAGVRRDPTGRISLSLRRRTESLAVSRLYGGRFRFG